MPMFQNNVIVENAILLFEDIKQPQQKGQGTDMYQQWGVKIVFPDGPDAQLVQEWSNRCLQESAFRGVLPNGGTMPLGRTNPGEFNDQFPNHNVMRVTTYHAPAIFDDNGQQLQPMQYGPLLFAGQRVNVMMTFKDFNNQSKGIKAQLEGIQIQTKANATPINVGTGGGMAAAAFGGQNNGGQNFNNGGQNFNNGGQQYDQNNGGQNFNNGGQQYDQNNGGQNFNNGGQNFNNGGQQYDQNNGGQQYDQNNGGQNFNNGGQNFNNGGQNNGGQNNGGQNFNNGGQNNGGQNNGGQNNGGQNNGGQNNGQYPSQSTNFLPQ